MDHAAVITTFDCAGKAPRKFFNAARMDPDLLENSDTKALFLANFDELLSQQFPTWDPLLTLVYMKMCVRTAGNKVTAVHKSQLWTKEQGINDTINDLIDKVAT